MAVKASTTSESVLLRVSRPPLWHVVHAHSIKEKRRQGCPLTEECERLASASFVSSGSCHYLADRGIGGEKFHFPLLQPRIRPSSENILCKETIIVGLFFFGIILASLPHLECSFFFFLFFVDLLGEELKKKEGKANLQTILFTLFDFSKRER